MAVLNLVKRLIKGSPLTYVEGDKNLTDIENELNTPNDGKTYGRKNSNLEQLSDIATSGDYNDLTNTPTNVSDFINDSGFITVGAIPSPQNLAISGNDLSISGGNTVVLPSAGGGTIDYQLTEQLIPFEKYKGQDMYAILLPVSDENGNPYTYVNHADILFISVGKVISEWLVANPSNKIVYINPITPDFTLAQPYDYRWNFPEVLVKYIKEGENFLLQENGDNILQENGDNILI